VNLSNLNALCTEASPRSNRARISQSGNCHGFASNTARRSMVCWGNTTIVRKYSTKQPIADDTNVW